MGQYYFVDHSTTVLTNENQGLNLLHQRMKISQGLLEIIALVFAALALLISLVRNFFLGSPARAIDYLQWGYIFSIIFATVEMPFSSELNISYSVIGLKQGTSEWFCDKSLFTCGLQFGTAFAAILWGVILIFRLVTIPQKVREKGLTFHRVYKFLKGMIRWFYIPFAYLSVKIIFDNTKGQLIPPIIILCFVVIFPIVQLILYKFFPESQDVDPMYKWIEFLSYIKGGVFAFLVVLGPDRNTTAPYFFISALIIGYAAFYGYFYNFQYPRAGRVLFIIGQVAMFFLVSLYISNSGLLRKYYLDLFILGAILLMDFIYTIMEIVHWARNRRTDAEVVPQDSNNDRKKNSFEVEAGEQNSKDNLNDSKASSRVLGKSGSKQNVGGRARRK